MPKLSAVLSPAFVPIMDHAEFAALSAEVTALRADAEAIKRAIRQLEQRAAEMPDANSADEIDRIARAELNGKTDDSESMEQIVARIATLRTRYSVARCKLDLKRADLQAMKSTLSVDAAAIYRPRHRAAVANVLAAWTALRNAVRAERQSRVDFHEAGYDSRMPAHGPAIAFAHPGYDLVRWEEAAKAYVG